MRDTSDLRAWYREDLAQLISGIRYMHNCRAVGAEYSAGFLDALMTMCIACGIDPQDAGLERHELRSAQ